MVAQPGEERRQEVQRLPRRRRPYSIMWRGIFSCGLDRDGVLVVASPCPNDDWLHERPDVYIARPNVLWLSGIALGACGLQAVECATLEWVDWFNFRRLLEPIGNVPPAEAAAAYHARLQEPWIAPNSLRENRYGSLFAEEPCSAAAHSSVTQLVTSGRPMPQRETLNVSLPAELKRYVTALVDTGNYGSASEVVRAALRLLQERNRAQKASDQREQLR